jgi:glutathione S-transferase
LALDAAPTYKDAQNILTVRALDITTSVLATVARAGSGAAVGSLGARPKKPLELYDFEACPYCRKVREALSILDLEAIVYPCPKGGSRFRERLKKLGGKVQCPYLVDPNTGTAMYESDDIVAYLFATYGSGSAPLTLRLGVLTLAGSALASLARLTHGEHYRTARAPEKPLELWSFEASPFCRLVREELTVLELPYLLHNVAKGSASRAAFIERSGRMMVPYLADPNTATEMFESADIIAYLRRTYA